jgi:hypothetical protein
MSFLKKIEEKGRTRSKVGRGGRGRGQRTGGRNSPNNVYTYE